MASSRTPGPDELRVFIVSDDPLARQGLSALIAREPGLTESGQVDTPMALRASQASRADVILWDVGSEPSSEGSALSQSARSLPLLALIVSEGQAAEALGSGARGCLSRDVDPARLIAALRAVALGLRVLDETAALAVLRTRPEAAEALIEPLTPREQEVLELLSLGWTNKTIARRLGISDHTAKFHVNSVLTKLSVESRTEAVVKAARLGLVVL